MLGPWYSSPATPGNSSPDTPGKLLWCNDLQAPFRNQGGFNIIGSGRDKIESPEQLAAAAATVRRQTLHSAAHCLHCLATAKHSGPGQLRTPPNNNCHGRRLLRWVPCSTARQ